MGLADLHLHTIYSYDGTASVPAVLNRAKQLGLDVIAITDHDEIKGALKAMELASAYGVEVIPGIEITTADGDLLAFFITEKVDAGLSLVETVLRVRELGGVCVAPHPMAGGMGMKSLKARTILKALRNPAVAEALIGIEVYNGTSIDRISNHSASLLASRLHIAKTGSSDAHVIDTIGFGATEFDGSTAADLLMALKNKTTKVCKQNEWSMYKIMGSWALNYIGSVFIRLAIATQ
ncbi:MAG: PHP domain-containing protein [Anaerolineales bacterium]|nr:PHP domain-containing protein [Anaerolineales bacterium]